MALPIKIFTPEELKAYFRGDTTNHFYKECVAKHTDFLPHSDGERPTKIIDKQRPNEPDNVKQFRLDIWEPITKPTFARLVSSLSKIRRSSDWSIIYPADDFNKIRQGNELEEYCEKNYPYFTSITNWVFSVLLKQYLIDPNAVVLVTPIYTEGVKATDFLEPFTSVYNSCDVIDFREQEYAILRIPEGCTYMAQHRKVKIGKSYYVLNALTIERYDQIDDKGNFEITYLYEHNLNYLPAFKVGGVICNSAQNMFMYESRIAGILPNLNEAIAEYTDLQAGKRLNIYPERWEFTQHECSKCKGTGMTINTHWKDGDSIEARQIKCVNCNNGYIPSGPYSKMLLRPADVGQQSIPNPPAGFIEKDIEIIRLMDESVDKHIYKALASINFQFLEQVPLNQSGVAKEVDKEELNNTVHGIAEDLVALMDKIYKAIAYFRYSNLYTKDEIDKMLPKIPVPEHFDLISSQYMQDEIKRARESKINPLLISEMEVEYSGKRFAQDIIINKVVRLIHELDPLPGTTVDDKLAMNSNKTITRESNIISDNIVSYVRRALFENPDFDSLEFDKQKQKMLEYAEEQIKSMDETAKLISKALMGEDEGLDDQGNPIDETKNEPITE
jgi:hypothetical protein